jgi:prepilin-type processing-associated H-X9-DG protein
MHGSYRAVSGRAQTQIGHGAWDTCEPALWPGSVMDRNYRGALHGTTDAYNGIPVQTSGNCGMGGPEPFSKIVDGLSNCLMVGEATFIDTTRRSTFWAYTYASYNQSSVFPESRALHNMYGDGTAASKGCWTNNSLYADQLCKRIFGSNHAKGANFVMCDGSVRFIAGSVDMNILSLMASIADGQNAQLP